MGQKIKIFIIPIALFYGWESNHVDLTTWILPRGCMQVFNIGIRCARAKQKPKQVPRFLIRIGTERFNDSALGITTDKGKSIYIENCLRTMGTMGKVVSQTTICRLECIISTKGSKAAACFASTPNLLIYFDLKLTDCIITK